MVGSSCWLNGIVLRGNLLPKSLLVLMCTIGRSANGSDSFPAMIRHGYDSLRLEHKLSLCMQGDAKVLPASEAVVSFNKVDRWSRLNSHLNFYIPGSVFLKSDTELGRFVLRARDSSRSATYLLRSSVTTRKEVLTNPHPVTGLTEVGDDFFRSKCGTQYVSLIESGGELHVGIKFSFVNSHHREQFEAGGAITSIAGLGAHVKSLQADVKKNASVEIFFHQVGGKLQELDHMFKSQDVAACSLENFAVCEGLIRDLWDYSTDQFAKAVEAGQPQVISFRTSDYPDRDQVFEDPLVIKGRKQVLDSLSTHLVDRDYLASLALIPNGAVNCDSRCLSEITSRVSANIHDLQESVRLSFLNPDRFVGFGMVDRLGLYEYLIPKLSPPRQQGMRRWGIYLGAGVLVAALVPSVALLVMKSRR